MRNILAICILFAALLGNAQNNVPVSTLPAVDSLGQNDFFPVVQGGRYHKAYIWQLPLGAGCSCQPKGGNGYVQYNNGSGVFSADSLFTRNPATLATTIAYYDTGEYKISEQVGGGLNGSVNGAANQMYRPSNGDYALSGVADGSFFGGPKMMALLGVGNLNTGNPNGVLADTGGVVILTDSAQIKIRSNGITFGWKKGNYTFPRSNGAPGQVLTTDGMGNLSWQGGSSGGTSVPTGKTDTTGTTGGVPAKSATVPGGITYSGYTDSLFTRNPVTLQTTMAYYDKSQVKTGEQVGAVLGGLDGAANQMFDATTGNYAIAGAIDATSFGDAALTALLGIVNPVTNTFNLFSVDTGGTQMQFNQSHFGIGQQGLFYVTPKGNYIFPNYTGGAGQVLTTDTSGNLSWQNVSKGFIANVTGAVQYAGATGTDTQFVRNPLSLATTIGYTEAGFTITQQLRNVLGKTEGAVNQIYEPQTQSYAVSGVLDLTAHGKGMAALMGFIRQADSLGNLVIADSVNVQVKSRKNTLQLDSSGLSYSSSLGKYTFPQGKGAQGQVLTTDSLGHLSWQSTTVNTNNVQTAHVTITQAQITNMVSSPVQLLPAPGAGKFIQVIALTGRLNFNTTPYTDTTAVPYSGSYNTSLTAYFDTSNLNMYSSANLLLATQSTYSVFNTPGSNNAGTFVQDNAPLMLSVYDNGLAVPTDPFNGDGTLDIYITYTIISE